MRAIPMPKRVKFLTSLSLGNSVTKACKDAELSRRTAYYWRDEDEEFANEWDEALATSVEELEDEVRARAFDREDVKSATLLMFLLKKHRPEYRENYQQKKEVTIHHTKEFDFSQKEMRAAVDILNAALDEEDSSPAVQSSDPREEQADSSTATSQEPDES